ncbi:MAG: methyl-accepting chemotaxis protein, partial [Hydrogenovibrio sp.]|nr:methyl-accepting chemotaxis protein [Hydrogenovibrio sp.]
IRVGTLVEWRDRTQEVQLLENVQGTVKNAQRGYLSDRIDLGQLEGVAYDLSLSINELMDAIEEALSDVSHVTSAMADGDLTEIITKNYEGELGNLKNSINASISRLDGIVSVAAEAARVVDGASREVSQGASDLSDRVQNQAAALEETSATMHEMNSAIQNNTQNAQEARNAAVSVQERVDKGRQVMEQNIDAMNTIQESSHKISDIVSLIDGIAFQTNLLALNAAVEAARAGEHGRGFAVVAGEVRALAQKSAEAARDIKSLIDESVQRIDQGTQLTTESGEVLVSIATEIDNMTKMIGQIAEASEEQAKGISQVHEAINSIDQVTQQNAALVEETTSAAESMNEQAKNLTHNMSYFKTTNQVESSSLKSVGHQQAKPLTAQKPVLEKSDKDVVEQNRPKDDEWSTF